MRAPRFLRRPVTALLLALSLTAPVASAGPESRVSVTLPAGEPARRWHATLDAAGLELALKGREATVHIEAGASRWRLVALDTDGGVARELFVPAPVDDTDRREIAMLARANIMRLEPLNEPGVAVEAPPPPAPPPPPPMARVQRAPEPPRPTPPPVAPAPPIEVVDVDPIAPAPLEAAGDAPEASENVVVESDPAYDEVVDVSRRSSSPRLSDALVAFRERRRARRAKRQAHMAAPPISLLMGTSFRRETQTAGVIGLDVTPLTVGRAVFGTEFAVQGARGIGLLPDSLDDGDDLWRQFIDVRGLASLGVQLTDGVRVGAVGGAAYRTFRQQFVPVSTSIMPVVGAQAEVVSGRIVRAGVRVQVLRDLVATELVDSTVRSRTLVPLEVGTSFVLRIQPRQRPRPRPEPKPEERSAPRSMDLIDLEEMPEERSAPRSMDLIDREECDHDSG
ncbi:MAG: hypothetical protein AAF602_24190, partial [Myxococcota bacterium]